MVSIPNGKKWRDILSKEEFTSLASKADDFIDRELESMGVQDSQEVKLALLSFLGFVSAVGVELLHSEKYPAPMMKTVEPQNTFFHVRTIINTCREQARDALS